MTMTKMGAMYLIMMVQGLARANFDEARTSSMIAFGLIIQPTNTQVSNATMGIMTELEMKSKKSSSWVPGPSGSIQISPL